jgi:hypothetical protein
MVATELIPAGSQIWNTYGDPPNSDLLRQYGHVDLIPCKEKTDLLSNFLFENPADEVEMRADTVLDVCLPSLDAPGRLKKADDWLSLGGEEYVEFISSQFTNHADPRQVPLLSVKRTLCLNQCSALLNSSPWMILNCRRQSGRRNFQKQSRLAIYYEKL